QGHGVLGRAIPFGVSPTPPDALSENVRMPGEGGGVPLGVKKACQILNGLMDEAVACSSPASVCIRASEPIPWWLLLAVARDMAQAVAQLHQPFRASTVTIHLPGHQGSSRRV
ncbi:unnamed protein product, partial [Discosporangium mesarthrocarpum]